MKRNTRVKSFIREFPDAIEMMISALKAGHAFTQSMQMVGIEAPDPVGIEFKKTFEEHNLGRDLRESLLNLTERVPSLDLKLFVTAILLQRETGGNLTEILENISHTIRERFKLIGQMKIYTAQGRMSGLIIGSLPIVFVLIMSVLNPDYLKPLIQENALYPVNINMMSSEMIPGWLDSMTYYSSHHEKAYLDLAEKIHGTTDVIYINEHMEVYTQASLSAELCSAHNIDTDNLFFLFSDYLAQRAELPNSPDYISNISSRLFENVFLPTLSECSLADIVSERDWLSLFIISLS